jgi:hypothetical protein
MSEFEISPIARRARAHYVAQGRRSLPIPEWTDEAGAATVVYSTPLTMAERRRINARTMAAARKDDAGNPVIDPTDDILRTIIDKTVDADGKRIFSPLDLPVLEREVEAEILSRIYLFVTGPAPTAKAVEKN